jgi:hypothetical protein
MHHTAWMRHRNHPSPGLTAQIIAISTGRDIRWLATPGKFAAGRRAGMPCETSAVPPWRAGGPALTAGDAATHPD